MPATSIDELLLTNPSKVIPPTSEKKEEESEGEDDSILDETDSPNKEIEPANEPEEEEEETPLASKNSNVDEYGNEKPQPKTYTDEEVNERINRAVRERIARMERNGSQNPQNTQQAKNPEYDQDSSEDWQKQLEGFVEQTVSKISQKQVQQQQAQREQQIHAEFEDKLHRGMARFDDFVDVVGSMPFSDAMTIATRSMSDPAAFIYAASKRNAADIQRIANINDPYTQIVEIGRLEERMKKNKAITSTPKPISRTPDDGTSTPRAKKAEPSIEQMMQDFEERKRAKINARRK